MTDKTYTSGDRVKTWTGDLGTIMHGGPHNYKVQVDGGGQLWYEASQLEPTTTPTPAGRYDDDEIERLLEKATPGEWTIGDHPDKCNEVAYVRGIQIWGTYKAVSCKDDANLIAAAPAIIRQLRRERDAARAALEAANEELEGRLAAIRAADALIEAMQLERLAYRMTANAQPPGVGGESAYFVADLEDAS